MADLIIVVGTYNGGLIGLQGPPNQLKTVFAFSSASVSAKSGMCEVSKDSRQSFDIRWI